jgi:hypothetical protein
MDEAIFLVFGQTADDEPGDCECATIDEAFERAQELRDWYILGPEGRMWAEKK